MQVDWTNGIGAEDVPNNQTLYGMRKCERTDFKGAEDVFEQKISANPYPICIEDASQITLSGHFNNWNTNKRHLAVTLN